MSEEAFDLSGEWRGIFNYPAMYPPNEFQASLRDSAGVLTGLISQPREIFEGPGPDRQAVIEGSRDGARVRFVKIYDDLERPTPHYEGMVQAGGDEIAGTWTIPGDWTGTFIMIRQSKAANAVERKVSEEVR